MEHEKISKVIKEHIPEINILAVIQHGSSIHKELITKSSDKDLFIISDKSYEKKMVCCKMKRNS